MSYTCSALPQTRHKYSIKMLECSKESEIHCICTYINLHFEHPILTHTVALRPQSFSLISPSTLTTSKPRLGTLTIKYRQILIWLMSTRSLGMLRN